ncbi:MAG: hypothetical protein HRT35_25730 [Algicola sp.]|nr:hypothetical protein [Algicola sp.]
MKAFKLLTVAAALVATSAGASTYNTTVSIDDLSTVLAWEETTRMQFPTLLLDSSTANGNTCYTYSAAASNNLLCPTSRSSTTNALFTITGTPNANVRITLDTAPQTVEGIKFTPVASASTVKLNSSGTSTNAIYGYLTLIDRTEVASTSINFTYNLEFVGQ